MPHLISNPVIHVQNLWTHIGGNNIHEDLSFAVESGEILGMIGASGAGKSVLLRTLLGLITPTKGSIRFWGHETVGCPLDPDVRKRWGVLFQSGALFSSLTVGENIQLPLIENAGISGDTARDIAALKLAMVGLPADTFYKYPRDLSGGMVKRAALARALALDAELLFLDEPTSGLDPLSAQGFDELLNELRHTLGLTVVMITHDLDSLRHLCDQIAVLINGQIIVGSWGTLENNPNQWIQTYFKGRCPLQRKP